MCFIKANLLGEYDNEGQVLIYLLINLLLFKDKGEADFNLIGVLSFFLSFNLIYIFFYLFIIIIFNDIVLFSNFIHNY